VLKRLSDPRDSAGARLAVRLKDLELALDLARRHQANLELATCAAERFGHWVARHGPEADQTSCSELWDDSATLRPANRV
jgi:3-hydroxyisobutyrate dehydrogenase-like beta-hydroxyacid dehydrogenase